MPLHISELEVLERAATLPAFPRIVNQILETLEDENASMNSVIDLVEHDPVIAARILSIANSAAIARRGDADVRGMQVAVSMVGLSRLREIVLGVSLAEFSRHGLMAKGYWEHSCAVGVAAQELAKLAHVNTDHALVCGLLHDIGQLWMARFYPLEFQLVRMSMQNCPGCDIRQVERTQFGTDHSFIGSVLAKAWLLPASVVAAIAHHHDPEPPREPLVAVTHVAEALAHALDLTQQADARVLHLSESACQIAGIDWTEDLSYLFGKIEARARYARQVLSY